MDQLALMQQNNKNRTGASTQQPGGSTARKEQKALIQPRQCDEWIH